MRTLLLTLLAIAHAKYTYKVTVIDKPPTPVISVGLPVGSGHSNCTFTFNPAFILARPPQLNQSLIIVRASGCSEEYGGSGDHLLMAYCDETTAICGDVQPTRFPFESAAEDPRVFYNDADGQWYMYYFASGPGQSTVYLRRTPTPMDPTTWTLVVGELPWHRNGCALQLPNGTNVVIYGETYGPKSGPLPAIGIATTADWVNYTVVNSMWMDPNPNASEVCLEAATAPVLLSTGDYMHLFAAGLSVTSPGGMLPTAPLNCPSLSWKSYQAGFLILDGNDPSNILQRSTDHPFQPTMDYEIGNSTLWPVNRCYTLFVTSLIPIPGQVDTFRAWYGAADANVATAVVRVTHD